MALPTSPRTMGDVPVGLLENDPSLCVRERTRLIASCDGAVVGEERQTLRVAGESLVHGVDVKVVRC